MTPSGNSLRSQSHQRDESLKVCRATLAAGKQPELYNSSWGLGEVFSLNVWKDRRRRNMRINEEGDKRNVVSAEE